MPRSIALALALLTFLAARSNLPADEAPQPEELFRTLDANGDGTLSADEIGEPQRQAFERLLRVGDADKDGRLTREEYLKGFQPDPPAGVNPPGTGPGPGREGQPRRRPDFDRLFEMADRDGDGRIALNDLPEAMRQRMQPVFERLGKEQLTREDFERLGRPSPGQRAAGQPRADHRRLFERFDEDGDGTLTRDEIPVPLRRRFDPLFERLDKQELTRDDFTRALRQQRLRADGDRRPGEAVQPEGGGLPLRMLGRLLDADGDGQLTTAEIDSLSEKFAELDADGDGKLTGAELTGLTDRLVPRDGNRRVAPRDGQPRRPDGSQPAPP